MPFFADQMYQSLKLDGMPESVHLCDWPESDSAKTDLELEQNMDEVRSIVTLALALRSKMAIKVRQPLASLKIKNSKSQITNKKELIDLIKDEVNVKDVIFDDKIENEIELDTTLTQELKEEGIIRDIVRDAQEKRKELGLKPDSKADMEIEVIADLKAVIEKNSELLKREIRVNNMSIVIGDSSELYSVKIKKI